MRDFQNKSFQTLEKNFNQSENPFLTEEEIAFLEMDAFNLGLSFDSVEHLEFADENIIGIEFTKTISSPFEIILVKSIDIDLLKNNLAEVFEDYDTQVTLDISKKIGKRVKEYQLKVIVINDQQFWEEYINGWL